MSRPAKIPKAEAVDRITALRADGYSVAEIAIRLGLSDSTIGDYIQQFQIPKGSFRRKICPHCARDIKSTAG
jgi:transposase